MRPNTSKNSARRWFLGTSAPIKKTWTEPKPVIIIMPESQPVKVPVPV